MDVYIRYLPLLGLLLIATATDVARHRIYNWNTYPGILLGLGINTFLNGTDGLQFGLAGFLACGFIMLFCFVLFNMGGGDLKLIAMMGAFLGWQRGVEAMLWTFIIGGVMGVAVLLWQFGLWHIVKKTWGHLRLMMRARTWIPLDEKEREPLKRWLFLAPAGLAAGCLQFANALYGFM